MLAALSSDGDSGGGDGQRRAALAFADVVGYSILMAEAERRTYERWMALLQDVVAPLVERYRGRVVDLAGDGALCEFPDAPDAVAWALELQRTVRGLHEAAKGAEPDEAVPIALRIALHVGEVFAARGRLFGTAVNVAARLQEHAQPGGIVLSEEAYEIVRDHLGSEARDLGPIELKNVARVVRLFAVDTHAVRVALPMPRPGQATLPSIAVLPLQNLGGNPDDDYFADGIVEDITVSLAGLRELFVIARTSALAFRGREPDPGRAGRALGVQYVLMGSIRRAGRRLRVSVQLTDVRTGGVMWGEQIAVGAAGLFDVQDGIVREVVTNIAPNVRAAELSRALRKRAESFTAYDHTLRALHVINSLHRRTFLQARENLDAAMADDPRFAMAAAWAARWHSLLVGQGWSEDPARDVARARELAERAIELDPSNALALATYGHQQAYLLHDCEAALPYFERALAACPNSSIAWILSSATLSYLGRGNDAVRHAEQGLRLSPLDESRFSHYTFLGIAHYVRGSYAEAVAWARRSARENPLYTATRRLLIVALMGVGLVEEARAEATRLLELEPGFRLDDYERARMPYQDATIRARCMEHLRGAGLPE